MKVANILPQAFLHQAVKDDYHMALAHMVQEPGFQAYTSFFRTQARREGSFVMLDTGLIEGNARPIEELLRKAKYLEAQEMVLNDVFMEKAASLEATYDAMNFVKGHGHGDIRLMGIPQGKNLAEWVEAAKEIVNMDVDTIGIPKVLVKLEGMHGRLEALKALTEFIKPEQQVHLLGCWETALELATIQNYVRQGSIVPVRGCDTVLAYAYASNNMRFSDGDRPQGPIDFQATKVDEKLLEYNIMVLESQAELTIPPADNIIQLF
jgi:hypothetical protein